MCRNLNVYIRRCLFENHPQRKAPFHKVYVLNGVLDGCASAVVAAAGVVKDTVAEMAAKEEEASAEFDA